MILTTKELKELGKILEATKIKEIDIKLNELERHRPYLQKEFYARRDKTLKNERIKLTYVEEEVF